MRKSTFLSIAILSAASMAANAQTTPEELVWDNSGGTGIWGLVESEWGKDYGGGVVLPTGWADGALAIFNGQGKFTDAEGAPTTVESIKVDGAMTVAGIKVSGDKNYTLSYKTDKTTDKIQGEGSLIKEGSGDFTLNVLNTLKEGTIARGGRVVMDKVDSPNAFGDTLVFEGGAVGFAPADVKTAYAVDVPMSIAEGQSGAIWAGRYTQLNSKVYGKGTLTIYTGGERVFVTSNKDGKMNMPWEEFEGDLIIDVNEATAASKPGYYGLMLNTTLTFEGVNEMTGIDNTLLNKKVTLKADAGLAGASGTRCFAIGELNAEEGGFISGYGAGGSTSPEIYYAIGYSNTDVTIPLWLRDNRADNKNKFGLIKEGTGTYIFTGTKNAATKSCFKGLHIKNGRAYINTSVDDASITALCRNGNTAMTIYEGAIGGGNGRITSEVLVNGGTLEIGCQGIGQLILDDIEGETIKSPLTVKNNGVVEFEISSATSYDKLTTNSTATFNGNKIIVKAASSFDIKDGDTFTILDAAVKPSLKDAGEQPIEDTYVVEFQGFPAGVTLNAVKEEYQSGTKLEGEGDAAIEVPVMGYRIVVKATGSGSGSGVEMTEAADEVIVYAQDGNIIVKGDAVENVTVMNNQGQTVANATTSVIPVNAARGLYIVRVKTATGIIVKKVIL